MMLLLCLEQGKHFSLHVRYRRGSKKVKSKPPNSKADCGVWKDDPERMELNYMAEVPGEDRDYVHLEPSSNTGSGMEHLKKYNTINWC